LLHSFADLYEADPASVTGEYYGLNHLGFFSSIKLNGQEIMPELMEDPRLFTDTDMRVFKPDLIDHMGCILNEYLY
ncbi:MAG: 6-phospho-beta-glucosidase, partial [Firmicutes bacterium]|nr:6-phospho-beta-glucosidase [Bacillota bacterium]